MTSELSKYFPINFTKEGIRSLNPSVPWISAETGTTDDVIHFDSLSFSNLPPKTNFALRVTILNDATLLGFRIPHYLADGQSMFDVVKAYCDLVADRDILRLVPPPDIQMPLSQLTKSDLDPPLINVVPEGVNICTADEVHTIGLWNRITRASGILLRHLTNGLFASRDFSERYIYLPKQLVLCWQSECQRQLEAAGLVEVKLSKLDVIAAWYLKVIMYTRTQ